MWSFLLLSSRILISIELQNGGLDFGEYGEVKYDVMSSTPGER